MRLLFLSHSQLLTSWSPSLTPWSPTSAFPFSPLLPLPVPYLGLVKEADPCLILASLFLFWYLSGPLENSPFGLTPICLAPNYSSLGDQIFL